MTPQLQEKSDLINKIMARANSAAILADRSFSRADMFFSLAFMSIPKLKKLAEKIDA